LSYIDPVNRQLFSDLKGRNGIFETAFETNAMFRKGSLPTACSGYRQPEIEGF
jgi:hypothetical protein